MADPGEVPGARDPPYLYVLPRAEKQFLLNIHSASETKGAFPLSELAGRTCRFEN